ncbi:MULTISPECIES: hypothetical protein [unclassified Sphingosinithalassobacter]|uniref:hypothetical protein n=1 Tax=unclassified Sphingosinithalassobacter TaxID=2676235 RepID=UPI00165D4A8E|nr:hypothetical protein [Sphingosinithalassobacter sp. CS137]
MTDISVTSPIERVARVICAEARSPNGQTSNGGAAIAAAVSGQIDASWDQEVERAKAVLRTLREPTPEMVAAGRAAGSDPAEIWSAMVRAGLGED